MSDEVVIGGISYISSKRASVLSGYAQDYIGQLARAGLIDAQRIGGLWYVSLESLQKYQERKDAEKPVPPQYTPESSQESLVFLDGKEYFSAARASEVTGYHQDYIGQLARSGKIVSRQVGNRWYVERDSVIAHKKSKDDLLAAVQADAVGISVRREPNCEAQEAPLLSYHQESRALIPEIRTSEGRVEIEGVSRAIPIRAYDRTPKSITTPMRHRSRAVVPMPKKYSNFNVLTVSAATIVVLLSLGLYSFSQDSKYAASGTGTAFTASVSTTLDSFSEWIQEIFSRKLDYTRAPKD
jgi:hypothetical protein